MTILFYFVNVFAAEWMLAHAPKLNDAVDEEMASKGEQKSLATPRINMIQYLEQVYGVFEIESENMTL